MKLIKIKNTSIGRIFYFLTKYCGTRTRGAGEKDRADFPKEPSGDLQENATAKGICRKEADDRRSGARSAKRCPPP